MGRDLYSKGSGRALFDHLTQDLQINIRYSFEPNATTPNACLREIFFMLFGHIFSVLDGADVDRDVVFLVG